MGGVKGFEMRALAGMVFTSCLLAAPALAEPQKIQTGSEASGEAAPVLNIEPQGSSRLNWVERPLSSQGPSSSSALSPAPSDRWGVNIPAGGRWGLTLDVTRRTEQSLLPREEMTAGAYYQVTPRFRFGGGVTIGGDSIRDAARSLGEEQAEAGVRFQSAFSF